ncbi:hypothetical protein WICMUC_001551 [Wickerhamomyces mucosus]|uniref:Transcription initiation factor TFIID subunit 1 histone acetyltransferase domain-containing protein n=1 Tax=Wickerhamomyces mucosus TaxID=1378264 RepID=A0A9P8PW90_9ASCO|nr:hypothetical protein WICMUC_001551 [Wickerhamomyces mucosus]
MSTGRKKIERDITNEDDAFEAALEGGGSASLDFNKLYGSMNTVHAEDAIDFEDEDELADDELPDEELSSHQNANKDDDDDFFNELDIEGKQTTENDDQFDILLKTNIDDGLMRHENNGFEETDIVSFDNLAEKSTKRVEFDPKAKNNVENDDDDEDVEQRKFQDKLLKYYFPAFQKHSILKMNSVFGPKPRNYEYSKPLNSLKSLTPTKINLEVQADQRRIFKSSLHHHTNDNGKRVVTIEDDMIENQVSKKLKKIEIDGDLMLSTVDWDYEKIVGDSSCDKHSTTQHIEKSFEPSLDDYDDDAILEGQISNKIQLDLNDAHLLFIEDKEKDSKNLGKLIAIPTNEQLLLSKFNISNDNNYHLLKENYHSKIRSTIGNLNIEHSLPAFKLQSPYYKVKLLKNYLRNPHRDLFKVRQGQVMQFSKLKTRKRKKDKYKEVKELYNKTTDLTLADSGQTVLMEHSEQNPIVITNYGMGSKLINYYRKINEEDNTRAKLVIGETHVLGVQDKSPFWNFGFVEPGNSVPTLYNKLIRAPIFKHEPAQTDFLLIKSSGAGSGHRFYLKAINNLFLIGQLLPAVDIPGPHSRKVTTASKNRLKMIVYRILKRNPGNRLLVKDISSHFPDQNDMQNRQRLKEFMEYQRSGPDQGFWKLKEELPHDHLISPEDLTLLEAMRVSQQQLEDLSFYSNEEVTDELALWNLTKNFINATQGKAMLQLNGDPDGKSISFMKTSMKGGFKSFESNGHSYNVALQQKAYDEEISRQWYSQQKRFSGTAPAFGDNEEPQEAERKTPKPQKFLKITRMLRDKNGILQRTHEIVKDPEVIRAYIKRREKLEEDIIPDEVVVSNDDEKNQKLKKTLQEQLAKLQKNQERRNARKANKEQAESKGISKGKSTTRRCATCGAIGHIRTNKSCPMYHEGNP